MMRHTPLPAALFVRNRKRLAALLPPGALVLLHANDLMPSNADALMPFRQNNDLFYLSGIAQEETILLLFPDAKEKAWQEVLFVRKQDAQTATWEGHKLSHEEASERSGIATVRDSEAFKQIFFQLSIQAERFYLQSNEHYRADVVVETRNARFIQWCQKTYPLHQYARLAPLMSRLRATKSEEEIKCLREACALTEKAFRRVLSFVRPGVKEYEIEAEYVHTFLCGGSRGFAYDPIIASGAHACVLHYTDNAATCQDKDLLLMDVGAAYAHYNADMTRCIPVNGRFSKRQRAVYDAVLRVMRTAMGLLRPGVILSHYQKEVEKHMEEALCQLGLLSGQDIRQQDPKHPALKRYFMHGVSHHLGLDVHDIPSMHAPLEVGAVLTVEPGIYIPEEQLGIRLENDVLLQKDGIEDLMASIPLEAEDIEALMQAKN